jgi:hypothetical protein
VANLVQGASHYYPETITWPVLANYLDMYTQLPGSIQPTVRDQRYRLYVHVQTTHMPSLPATCKYTPLLFSKLSQNGRNMAVMHKQLITI